MPHVSTWLKTLPQGLYCEPGGFYIDPLRPVDRAVITHAHSDHARPGHRAVLASADTLALMRARLGDDRAGETQQALGWGERLCVGDVQPVAPARGPCAGQCPGGDGLPGHAGGGQWRLQAHCRSDLRGIRAGAVRRVRHRGDLRAAGVPPSTARAGDRPASEPVWLCFRIGPTSWAVTLWASASA